MKLSPQTDYPPSAVAIIGMSCRFPGAPDLEAAWRNLRQGVEAISFFSDTELLEAGVEAAMLRNPAYVRATALLEGRDLFDADLFGFTSREAETLNPQHRVLLEVVWEALENAGCDPEAFAGAIGIFAGSSANSYHFDLLSHPELIEQVGPLSALLHNEKDFLATRVSYKLNLKGPSISLQTGCSTSLVAVHLACQSLLNGECDLALAGGVSVRFLHKQGYLYQEGGIASPDGHCRPFDSRAAGTVGGDGAGVVVLRRLDEALAEGDCIRAVILGSAINNDGAAKVGFTAPSIEGQAAAISEAMAVAGVDPASISYIEAHGTATPVGDPIEIAALKQAFGNLGQSGFCAIGSLKGNLGHLDAAAGVAGLIKTVLSLERQELPPSLHFESPNPQLGLQESPFYVNSRLQGWKRGPAVRRAGVSSFGMGGTNAHLVLEEAPLAEPSADERPWQLFPLSAHTPSALDTLSAKLRRHLKAHPQLAPAEVAYTLQAGRRRLGQRRFVVARGLDQAMRMLEGSEGSPLPPPATGHRPVTFMFPGQGAQHPRMCRQLYESEEVFRACLDPCFEALAPRLEVGLDKLLLAPASQDGEMAQLLQETRYTQPALFAVEYALAQLWMSWGVAPESLIGHSVGEYTAACLAGVFSLQEGLELVAVRGRLIQSLPPGEMLTVSIAEDEVQEMLGSGLDLAALNAPSRCVVSGEPAAIQALAARLSESGIAYRRLRTSHAFHSRLMEPIAKEFAQQLAKVDLQPPRLPLMSNLSGTWMTPQQATDPAYWVRHLRHTVRFSQGVSALAEPPSRIFLEVGPGRTLCSLVKLNPSAAAGAAAIPSLGSPDQAGSEAAEVLRAAGQLWAEGVDLDWKGMHAGSSPRKVPLPHYPFERRRFWIDPVQPRPAPLAAGEASGSTVQIFESQLEAMGKQLAVLEQGRTEEDRQDRTAPLTPIQQWFFEQVPDGLQHWNHARLLEVGRRLDAVQIGAALGQLMQRHDALRLRFKRTPQGWCQWAADAEPNLFTPLGRIDLSGLGAEGKGQAMRAATAMLQASLDIFKGPIARFALFHHGSGQPDRLLLLIHHLAVDIQSWQILVSELEALCRQLSAADAPRLPVKATSYCQWAERLRRAGAEGLAEGEKHYWLSPLRQRSARIPLDLSPRPNFEGAAEEFWLLMGSQEAQALSQAASRAGAQISDLLLAALGVTLKEWCQGDLLQIDLESHGREPLFDELNVASSVGWFTSLAPLLIDLQGISDAPQALGTVRRQLKSFPRGGIGYGLLRYLGRGGSLARRLGELPGAEVIFNYWGGSQPRRESWFQPAAEPAEGGCSPLWPRPHLLEVSATLSQQALQVCWKYSRDLHRRETIESVAGRFCQIVQKFWQQPGAAAREIRLNRLLSKHVEGNPMLNQKMDAAAGNGRLDGLRTQLTALLSGVLGTDASLLDERPEATFFELGADSLTLLQFSQAIQDRLGARVPFRLLMEELPSIPSLAAHIERLLPGEAPSAARPEAASPQGLHAPSESWSADQPMPSASASEAEAAPGFGGTDLDRLFARQLEVMNRQLAILGRPQPPGSLEKPQAAAPAILNSPPAPQAAETLTEHPRAAGAPPTDPAIQALVQPQGKLDFGSAAQTTLRLGVHLELDPRQKRHLESLIERIVARTGKSKELAAAARRFLADVRSASGFRKQWKEMVYLLVAERAEGARIWDADGNEYIDLTMGFGALLFGHSPRFLVRALHEQADNGLRLGLQSRHVGEAARLVCELTGHERATFCNSGTEAVMTAIRLARTVTGRPKLALFAGSYHGFSDQVLVRGSWSPEGGVQSAPMFPGVPRYISDNVIVLEYGNPLSLEILRQNASQLAAVLVEPLQSRRPDLEPREFLHQLRALTEETRTALIFDEVITGFRMHLGGAQAIFGVRADIATYGKAAGGGLPIGIVAGKRHFLDVLDGGDWNFGDDSYPRAETTFISGTFFKHPLTIHGVRAVLEHLKLSGPQLQEKLNQRTRDFADHLNAYFRQNRVPIVITHCGSLFIFRFPPGLESSELFYYHLLEKGVFVWERRICYLSTAHSEADIAQVVQAVKESVVEMRQGGFLPEAPPPGPEQGRSEAEKPGAPAPALAGVASAPLTEGQKGLWALAQLSQEAGQAYNEPLCFTLRGPLDTQALGKALQRIVDRHEALRSTFDPQGERQYFAPRLPADLRLVDFSGLAEPQGHQRAQQWLDEEISRPFELSQGPLFRFALGRVGEEQHVLSICMPHLITDGLSYDILLSELQALYTAFLQGQDCSLARPDSFADYARQQAGWLESEAGKASEAYWLKQFEGTVPTLNIPLRGSRPALQSYRGAFIQMEFPPDLQMRLKDWSARRNCTLFTTLLAAFNAFLHYLSGQDDLVVGVHSAGQMAAGKPALFGYCINMMPLRSQRQGTDSFDRFAADLRRSLLDAQAHQSYPVSRLIRRLQLVREPGRPPLVSVVFNMDRALSRFALPGLEVEPAGPSVASSRFDFLWNLVETRGGLRLDCTYNTDLFQQSEVEGWLQDYQALLDRLASSGQQSWEELWSLLEESQQQRQAHRDSDLKEARRRAFKQIVPRSSESQVLVNGTARSALQN